MDNTRFWIKVCKGNPQDCWLWNGAKGTDGYGRFNFEGKTCQAHRVVMGNPKGIQVLHTCDVRLCVNPAHLVLGTQKDNMHDMMKKERLGKRATLNNTKVRIIRSCLQAGITPKVLSNIFGTTPENIHAIKIGRSWA